MGLFLGWGHKLLCMHVYKDLIRCKSVCDIHPGIDPYPLLARLCNRLWPDFITFTACKKSRFGLKRGKRALCLSNRCKDLFERKKYFGVRYTLTYWLLIENPTPPPQKSKWTPLGCVWIFSGPGHCEAQVVGCRRMFCFLNSIAVDHSLLRMSCHVSGKDKSNWINIWAGLFKARLS